MLLTGGDKPTPGMVMAAARLDLPSILLYAGATEPGMHRGRKLFLETVTQADNGCDFDFLRSLDEAGSVPQRK